MYVRVVIEGGGTEPQDTLYECRTVMFMGSPVAEAGADYIRVEIVRLDDRVIQLDLDKRMSYVYVMNDDGDTIETRTWPHSKNPTGTREHGIKSDGLNELSCI